MRFGTIKSIIMKKVFLLAALAGTVLSLQSCDKNDDNHPGGVYKGPEVAYHEGKAFTWVQLSKTGAPEKLAIAIDEDVMENVPVEAGSLEGGHDHSNSISLQLHPKALAATPFRHVVLDWNPAGHEPDDVYTIPHFDFHFYMMEEAARLAIPPFEVNPDGFNNAPDAAYFPLNYVSPPNGVPQMGRHWFDVTSPELNGETFTQTFILGSYNGKVNFYEPMITRQFLLDNANFQRDIPQPAKFMESGYYPTKMRIQKHNHLTEIILEGFVFREKAN